jgi:hypothetical protein
MHESARFTAFIGIALLPIACGGAAQNSQPQNPSPVAVGSDPVAIAGDGQALAPATEPADVVAVARWKNPQRVFDTFQQWAGIPARSRSAIQWIAYRTIVRIVKIFLRGMN